MKNKFAVFFVIFCLSSSAANAVEVAIFSLEGQGCKARSYEKEILRYSRGFRPGLKREIVAATLTELATRIWRLHPNAEQKCKASFRVSFIPGAPLYSAKLHARISILLDGDLLCLNHDGVLEAGFPKPSSESHFEKYPWVYVDDPKFPNINLGRQKYLAICLDSEGRFKGHVND